jgi:hypothetical protein
MIALFDQVLVWRVYAADAGGCSHGVRLAGDLAPTSGGRPVIDSHERYGNRTCIRQTAAATAVDQLIAGDIMWQMA